MVAPALDRQQVRLDRLRDELVADLEPLIRPLDEEAVVDRLDDAGAEVRVEHAVAASRAGRRARRQALDEPLEGRRDGRQLATVQRPAGRGEEPQDAPALRRAAGQAREDQLVERRAERQAGQLAAGGEDLLGDQRVAAGALGDEQQRRGGRALALDLGDELGEVEPVERAELQLGRRVRGAGDRGELRLERVAARDAGRGRRSGRRHTRAGRATRARNVARLRVPASAWWRSSRTSRIGWRSPARSSRPWIASPIQALRRSGAIDVAAGVPNLAREPRRDRRAAAARSARRPEPTARRSSPSSSDSSHGREALDDRAVGGAAAGRHGGAADDLERRLSRPTRRTASVTSRLDADAAAPGHEEARAAALGGGLERDREVRELPLAPHEPLAAEPRGHGPIVPHGLHASRLPFRGDDRPTPSVADAGDADRAPTLPGDRAAVARPQLPRGLVGEHDLDLRLAHHADGAAVRGDPRPRRRARSRSR